MNERQKYPFTSIISGLSAGVAYVLKELMRDYYEIIMKRAHLLTFNEALIALNEE